jgi:hypothetical protein
VPPKVTARSPNRTVFPGLINCDDPSFPESITEQNGLSSFSDKIFSDSTEKLANTKSEAGHPSPWGPATINPLILDKQQHSRGRMARFDHLNLPRPVS